MRLLVHGATGRIGSAIVAEALERGHAVTAFVRNPNCQVDGRAALRVGEVFDVEGVSAVWAEHDAVVSAIGWTSGAAEDFLAQVAEALLGALRISGKRLVVVGGAGTLEVAPGLSFLDTPGFPPERRPNSLAQVAALEVLQQDDDDLPWVYLAPPAVIAPGQRTGAYRFGTDRLLRDDAGRSHISIQDFAAAVLDLLEEPDPPQGRCTVAY